MSLHYVASVLLLALRNEPWVVSAMRAANSADSRHIDIAAPRIVRGVLSLATLSVAMLAAPTPAIAQAAVRQTPTIIWATKLGFRDWGDVVRVNGLIVGSNSSGHGGLFAVDEATGKLRWKVVTSNMTGESPASDGKFVVVPWTTDPALAAYTLATGKLAWTKPFDPVDDGQPVIVDGLVIAQHEDGYLYAFDVATGAERWKYQYARKSNWCAAGQPAVADGIVYISSGLQSPANSKTDYFLHAIDAKTGQELWRYNPLSQYPNNYGACLVEVLAVGDTIVAVSDEYLYGVDRATGQQKYRVDTMDGTRRKHLRGLVQASGYVYGVTQGQFWAVDARTGRTAWTLPGEYSDTFVGTAAADGVVYFQGRVAGIDTGPKDSGGVLHAVDVQTRQVLWSFKYPTEEPWSFGIPVAADGAIFVGTYQTMLKLK